MHTPNSPVLQREAPRSLGTLQLFPCKRKSTPCLQIFRRTSARIRGLPFLFLAFLIPSFLLLSLILPLPFFCCVSSFFCTSFLLLLLVNVVVLVVCDCRRCCCYCCNCCCRCYGRNCCFCRFRCWFDKTLTIVYTSVSAAYSINTFPCLRTH